METVRRLTVTLAVAWGVFATPGCDEDAETSDEGAGPDVPAVVEGCPDGDALVEIGQTRGCDCDDGVASEQTCLSTGAFAQCQCVGGGW